MSRPAARPVDTASTKAGTGPWARAGEGGGTERWPPPSPGLGPVDPGALERAAAALAGRCPGRVTRALPLAPLTTFRLGGPAAGFLRAESPADLAALAEVLAEAPLPLLVIGRGSNMLIADAGWPGVALHLGQGFRWIRADGAELEAGGATPMPSLASQSAREGLGGIAFAVAIPGSVGGGVRMNAGAHGTEIADRLVWAEVVPLAGGGAGVPRRVGAGELGLSYRRSALPPGTVVTAARFALGHAPEAEVRAEIDEARQWRREHQPVNEPNCGSVFANPAELAAGRALELLGMKGEQVGGARVSEVHANFIVAGPGARSGDVLALIRRAQRRAHAELGVSLRTEVQLIGDFGPEPEVEVER